jgi:plasmid replication initiation protein
MFLITVSRAFWRPQRFVTDEEADVKPVKFEITVSGIDLSEEQKGQISTQMNTALLTALFGEAPGKLKGAVWSNILINGGRLFTGKLAAELQAAAEKSDGG